MQCKIILRKTNNNWEVIFSKEIILPMVDNFAKSWTEGRPLLFSSPPPGVSRASVLTRFANFSGSSFGGLVTFGLMEHVVSCDLLWTGPNVELVGISCLLMLATAVEEVGGKQEEEEWLSIMSCPSDSMLSDWRTWRSWLERLDCAPLEGCCCWRSWLDRPDCRPLDGSCVGSGPDKDWQRMSLGSDVSWLETFA